MNKWIVFGLIGLSSSVQALELVPNRVYLNSFGSIALAQHDQANSKLQSGHGSVIENSASFDFDSRIGLQLDAQINDYSYIYLQGLIQDQNPDGYEWKTKWAVVGLRPSSTVDIKIGRFLTPFYQTSQQQYIGYSQLWVRPPLEVYGTASDYDYLEGINTEFELPTQNFSSRIGLFAGNIERESGGSRIKSSVTRGAVFELEHGDLSLRLMLAHFPLELSGPSIDSLNLLLQQPSASQDYSSNSAYRFFDLGLEYNAFPWSSRFELIKRESDSYLFGEGYSWSATLGHQFDEYLPYLVFARQRVTNTAAETGLSGTALSTANNLIERRKQDQYTLGLGLRWDFAAGLAIKTQWDSIHLPAGSRGEFNVRPGDRVNLYTVSLEWAL